MTATAELMNVQGAFELLVEALEEEANGVNRRGGQAFERGEYGAVSGLLARADRIAALREKVLAIRGEWEQLLPAEESAPRRDLGHLPAGVRTSNAAFYRPILEALVALGGSAGAADVLARLEETMGATLNEVDRQPFPPTPTPSAGATPRSGLASPWSSWAT